jgi:hypothetical protein
MWTATPVRGALRSNTADFRLFCRQERLVEIIRTANLRLTSLSDIFYASSQWLKGITKAKMRPLPADSKNQITILLCPEFERSITVEAGVNIVDIEDCYKYDYMIFKAEAGVKISQGRCQQFAKAYACASTSILNYLISRAGDWGKGTEGHEPGG